jgi:hypothetical protein
MGKHPTAFTLTVEYTPDAVAEQLAELQYDVLASILRRLEFRLVADSAADELRGRSLLALHLHRAADQVANTAREIEQAWSICLGAEQSEE